MRYELDDPSGKCVNESAFRARVLRRLGYDPFREEALVHLRVQIAARAAVVHAEVESSEGGRVVGTRAIDDPSCDALVETVASTVALLLDPVAASTPDPAEESPSVPAPLPPPTAKTPSAPRDDDARESTKASKETSGLSPIIYGDGTLTFARAPSTLLGGRVGFGLRGAVSARAEVSVALEGHAETTPSAAVVSPIDRVEMTILSGALVPCAHVGILALCAVATMGTRQARALDVVNPVTQNAFFAAVGFRPGVEIAVHRALAIRANGELGVPLLRTRYTIDGTRRVDSSFVEGGVAAGIVGSFR